MQRLLATGTCIPRRPTKHHALPRHPPVTCCTAASRNISRAISCTISSMTEAEASTCSITAARLGGEVHVIWRDG